MTTTQTTLPNAMDLFTRTAERQLAFMGFVQEEWQKVAKVGQDVANSQMELGAQVMKNHITTTNAVMNAWNTIGQETVKRTVEAFEAAQPKAV